MPSAFMFYKCKPQTQAHSYPNVRSLVHNSSRQKSKKHGTRGSNTWPLSNSQTHFLLVPGINYPLFQSDKITCSSSYGPYSLFMNILKYSQNMHDLALPVFCTTRASYHTYHPQWPTVPYPKAPPILVTAAVSGRNCLFPTST